LGIGKGSTDNRAGVVGHPDASFGDHGYFMQQAADPAPADRGAEAPQARHYRRLRTA